jgi:predicted ATPase
MTDALNLLIITETVEILQALLDTGKAEWSLARLPQGLRLHRAVLLSADGNEPVHVAVATIEAISYHAAQQMTQSLCRRFRPQLALFLGRAMSLAAYDAGDLFIVQRVEPDEGFGFETGVLLQEARYLEASAEWRTIGQGAIRWGALWLPPGHTRAHAKHLGAEGNPPISPLGLPHLEHVALHCTVPRLLVLGVQREVRYVRDNTTESEWAEEGVVARRLAEFALMFFPDQIRVGNIRAIASATPRSDTTTTDDDTAALLRDLVDGLEVTSVSISHFKNIASLTLDLSAKDAARGRWTCIVGVNGAGKSAVLQAIAIVLLGDRLAAELGGDWLQRTRRLQGHERTDASLAVTLATARGEVPLRVAISGAGIDDAIEADPTYSRMRATWKARASHHLFRAYGPGRNLSEHMDSRYSKLSADVQAVMTLFDPLTQIASAEALVEKTPDAGFLPHLKSLVDHVFQDLGIETIIEGTALRFTIQGALLPVVDLPDGFRATLAWLADLCLGWFRSASEEDRALGISTLRAIVLIDEIDLHLHPKLQRSLVPRLREVLPHVQWIVTTHSPLVLGSFDSSEIVALEPDPVQGVRRRVLDREIMGFTLDEIVSWLMETPPRSLALDAIVASPLDRDARLALLLSQSPELSAEDATSALEAAQAQRDQADPGSPPEKDA